jgi:hypothetical protein
MLKGLNKLKICYSYTYNMFKRHKLYKSFYSTTTNPGFINNNYKNNGGGGDDPKLFYIILLGLTIYSVNKQLK